MFCQKIGRISELILSQFFMNKQKLGIFFAILIVIVGLTFVIYPFFQNPKPVEKNIDQKSQVQVEGSKTQASKISDSTFNTLPSSEFSTSGKQSVKVTRVVDGDTIEIEGGQKVRYIGINTPETVDPRRPVECFGKEAASKNRELVEGRGIYLEKDVSETDKYGRLLRYVYVDRTFVNDYMVRNGYAQASSYPPDVKYQNQLTQAQQEARQDSRGLWGSCQPGQSQASQTQTNQSGCVIKGNISSSGDRIYHMPGQKYYDKTVIDESKGEHWFCTENEAIAAGFRKSKI